MLRKVRIKTRLFAAFSVVVFFTLIVGITGFARINSMKDSSVKMIGNIDILNKIHEHNAAINSGVYSMLYISDVTLTIYLAEVIREHVAKLSDLLGDYLDIRDEFSDILTPGEIQDMSNLLEIFKEDYIPILHEVLNLVTQDKRDEAISVSINRFYPIYNTFSFYLNFGFSQTLKHALLETSVNNENASYSMYLMLLVILLSMVTSAALAFIVTESISVPLSRLERDAEKIIVGGELDVKLEQTNGNDEVAHLSQALHEALQKFIQIQQLKQETIEAKYQKGKAEAATRAKSDFLAKMSHEIRTPMNAIIGMTELALREDVSNAAREHIFTIKQAGINLLSIINDILDISKIESGKMEIVKSNYMFSSLVHDVVSIIRMKVVDSRLQFVVNIDSNIPNSLFGDELRIRQVILNVLSNAIKYTKRGFISFSVSGEIKSDDTVLLTIDVTDSGKGIKQEDMKKLFHEFTQLDLISNRGIEGTGLGLAITQSLVKAMDGDIGVQSEYKKGSTFTITLPQKIRFREALATVEKPEEKSVLVYEQNEIYADSIVCTADNLGVACERAQNDDELRKKLKVKNYSFVFVSYTLLENVKKIMQEVKSKSQVVLLTEYGNVVADKGLNILAMPVHSISVANILNGVSDNFSYNVNESSTARFIAPKAKVLVVDDINTNLKVAEGLMLPYKMQIDLCLNGLEAIEAVKEKQYDLVFMDHMMPGMDGIEVTKCIRGLDSQIYRSLPIVALTANAVSGTKEMFLSNGFNDFLTKPIDTIKLNAILEKWLPKEKQKRVEKDAEIIEIRENNSGADFEINGVDVKKGIAMTGGMLKRYMQTLAIFHKDCVQKMEEVKKSFEAKDYALYTIHIHALKSAAANIGAIELSETAKALEKAGKEEDFAFIKARTDKFLVSLKALLSGVNKVLFENSSKQNVSMDVEILRTELNKLKEALCAFDSMSIDEATNALQEFNVSEEIGKNIESILQNTLIGEYDEAVSTIDTMVKGMETW
jgi:signal transduction histidine kinase/CheY-like chemotaxis protein/HPt (histidine-containing phosphotransfer) domain-containing protein